MNFREGIIQALKANVPLFALVADRISSSFAPENTPVNSLWIVMTKISGNEEGSFDGDGQLTHPVFQFTVGGPDKADVDAATQILIDGFNAHEYVYTEDGLHYGFTFHHRDDRDMDWEQVIRSFKSSVDLEIWVQKQPQP